jgi:hypothetical protein
MRSLVRVFVCAFCLGSSAAIAQVVAGATAEPAETSIGNAVEISIDFQINQNANENANWRCGLNVNYGDGKSELHRVDSKQLPFKVTHTYDTPGNYAVTLEGKTQFQGLFNTVFSCSGQSRSVAIIVRAEDFAAREAEERAAQQEALNRATADREAAERAAERAKADRASAEQVARRAAAARANAQTPRPPVATTPAKVVVPKPQEQSASGKPNAETKPAPVPAPVSPPPKVRSVMDL